MGALRLTRLWLGVYAAAMALVEAAVVVYLRRIYYPDNPLALFPLRFLSAGDLRLEFAREAATLVMILAVAVLAVPGRVRQAAAFCYVFGVWDLCYYLWLKLVLGWPVSWAEWDILFLIPWPWLAPWVTPAAIALLFVAWGARVLGSAAEPSVPPRAWALVAAGLLLALASFLGPALPLLGAGAAADGTFVPRGFPWAFYLSGLALLGAGFWLGRRRAGSAAPPARPPVTSR